MKHQNKGQISIFACAMLCTFLILILTVLQGIHMGEGKAKCSQAVAAAADSIKGDFQPDLFRRYHILALDRTYYGRGEGYLEVRAKEFLDYSLSSGMGIYHFDVEEVILADTNSLTEDKLRAFKQQIEAHTKLRLPANVLESIWSKAEESDQSSEKERLSTELNGLEDIMGDTGFSMESLKAPTSEQLRLLGLDTILAEHGITDMESIGLEDILGLNLTEQGWIENPKDIIQSWNQSDILTLVIPEYAGSISKEIISLQNLPSLNNVSTNSNFGENVNRSIQSISDINRMLSENDLTEAIQQSPMTVNELYGIVYALDCFHHFADPIREEESQAHTFACEVEYLLEGQASDFDNLSKVAQRLSLVRFVPNAVYAFGNDEMKDAALLLAALLLAPVGLEGAAEPVSYVLLACWAYAESLMDVRGLLQGGTVPFVKDKDTWQLSLCGIQNLTTKETSGCELDKGMSYEEYLAIFLGIMQGHDQKYYRMLDVMQLNIQADIPNFRIKNCICEFHLQTEIREGKNTWVLEAAESYLP